MVKNAGSAVDRNLSRSRECNNFVGFPEFHSTQMWPAARVHRNPAHGDQICEAGHSDASADLPMLRHQHEPGRVIMSGFQLTPPFSTWRTGFQPASPLLPVPQLTLTP